MKVQNWMGKLLVWSGISLYHSSSDYRPYQLCLYSCVRYGNLPNPSALPIFSHCYERYKYVQMYIRVVVFKNTVLVQELFTLMPSSIRWWGCSFLILDMCFALDCVQVTMKTSRVSSVYRAVKLTSSMSLLLGMNHTNAFFGIFLQIAGWICFINYITCT